jgi:hypothetical protein
MAFMTPHYTKEPFVLVEQHNGETYFLPANCEGLIEPDDTVQERYTGKWFCRLSANGYMDCTSWDGPYDTLEQANTAIIDTWDVDPDTGDEMEDVA